MKVVHSPLLGSQGASAYQLFEMYASHGVMLLGLLSRKLDFQL